MGTYVVTVAAATCGAPVTRSFTLTVTDAPSCPTVGFAPASSFGFVRQGLLAVGDFNRDGKPDLLTRDSLVRLRLGNGDGTFAAAVRVGVLQNVLGFALGDFNGDGRQDFVTGDNQGGTVSVLLQLADGSFSQTDFNAGGNPLDFIAADFNGDGKQDFAVSDGGNGNNSDSSLTVYCGDGTGGFLTPKTITLTNVFASASPAAGDFNADGKTDLALLSLSFANNLWLLLGDGAGGFAATAFGTFDGHSLKRVITSDFNGDGKHDLAVTVNDANQVAVLLGQGNGSFAAPAFYAVGTEPDGLDANDFNGDGQVDLVVANAGADNVTLFTGNGAGAFTVEATLTTGNGPLGVVSGDFNGDGRQDLVTANGLASTFSALLNHCAINWPPTITALPLARTAGSPTAALALAQVSDANQTAATLTVTINDVASATLNGVTVSGLTIDAAGFVNANLATACNATNASFTLKVTDNAGTSATATLNVMVTATPLAFTAQPVARTVSANASASFGVTAQGNNLSYQWRKNGVALTDGWNVQGATTTALTLNPVLAQDAGAYDVVVSNSCGAMTSQAAALTVNGTAAPLFISEFRFSGPGGAGDWLVELYNNTAAPLRTNGLVLGFTDASGQLSESLSLLPELTIPAKGYYLLAGPQYSLGLAGAADQVVSSFVTLASLGGVALVADTLHPTKRIDSIGAQGFAQSAPLQYFIEGAATPALANTLTEHAFVRKFSNTGLPIDTNNNAADFVLVAPTTTPINGVTPQPGAPGPQNSASPPVNNAGLPVALLNPANSANSGPNTFVENVAVTMGTATYPRSLYLRRTLTNNTNKPVTRLRFRITELSNGGVNTAILRALNASDITINGQAVSGLTLETPPTRPTGGGLNSTLSAGSITLTAPMAAGAKVNVQFRLGIVQGGSYRFYANVEAAN